MLQILRFNFHQYGLAASVLLATPLIVATVPMPHSLRWAIILGAATAFYWTAASLLVSYWVYDYSTLTSWRWLAESLPKHLRMRGRWVNVHAGFDDTSRKLRALLHSPPVKVIDLYDPQRMTERSIRVARRSSQPDAENVSAAPDSLPLGDRSVDMAFLLLAAHEIRDRRVQTSFFRELHRVVRMGGRVVIVEHMRDVWNFAAFGPGCLHFFSRRRWLQLAGEAGFIVCDEAKHTPFITSFVLEKENEPDDARASRGNIAAVPCRA